MTLKHALTFMAAIAGVAFGTDICKQNVCDHYVLWGTARFANGVKVPLYEVTEYMDPLGNKYEKNHTVSIMCICILHYLKVWLISL